MIKILIGLAVLVAIYFYMQSKKEATARILESFIASDTFAGAKNGYVYKMDSQGLGYYLDSKK
jgi:hypothetical protein